MSSLDKFNKAFREVQPELKREWDAFMNEESPLAKYFWKGDQPMNRLESIKERVQNGITEYMHDANKAGIYREDATYLLQRLEIAQKALEQFADVTNWMGRGKETYPQGGIVEWDGEVNPIKLAKEALK